MILDINDNKKQNNNSDNFSSELNNYIQKTNSTFSIDRFENNFAVCENRETGEIVNIPITDLPENAKEGSILKFETGKYILDVESTKKEQQEIKNLVDNLFRKK